MGFAAANSDTARRGIGERFVEFIIGKPWAAFALGLVITAALTAGVGRVTTNFTHTGFFRSDDKMLQEFDKFERQYGNDDAVILVVHSPSGIFDVDSATLVQELTKKMWLLPEIIRVDSVANFSWVHAEEDDIEVEPLLPDDEPLTQQVLDERKEVALNHETLPDYLISRDGKTALIYARVRPGFEDPPDAGVSVRAARKLVAEMARSDHEFFLTGGATLHYAFKESAEIDARTLLPIVLLMAVFALIVLLRGIAGVLLPLLVTATAVMSAFGVAGWLGLEISSVTIVLPQVLIGVAIADSVHILSSFYRARRRGVEKIDAVRRTLTRNFVPTILTSLSTAVGFFSFSTSGLKPIFGLGVLAGCGTIVAWVTTYLLVGSLLVWLPSWVKAKGETDDLEQPSAWTFAYTQWLYRWRWAVIGFYALITAGATVLAAANQVNSEPYKYFAEDYPIRKAQDFILANLAGIAAFEMSIETGREDGIKDPVFLRRVEQFDQELTALDGISKTVSLLDVFKQTNRALNGGSPAEYRLPTTTDMVAQEFLLYTMSLPQGMDVNDRVTVKNDAIRMTTISRITDSARWMKTAERVKEIGRGLGLNVVVSGKRMLYQSMNGYVTRSFIQSLVIAVVLVSLILIVAFRSVRVGALVMLPNLVPLVIGGAVLKLMNVSLDIGTVLVCGVCLGIAVDDTIHILAAFRRHRARGAGAAHSIAMTLTHTGPALIVTTLVLVAAFGTLAFATFVPNVYFGIMTAVILSAALVADFTFLPALLMVAPRASVVSSGSLAPR